MASFPRRPLGGRGALSGGSCTGLAVVVAAALSGLILLTHLAAAWENCPRGSFNCRDGVYTFQEEACRAGFGKTARFRVTLKEMMARAPKRLQNPLHMKPNWNPRVRLAFLIKSHSPDTLYSGERLMRWLYHPGYRFAVHFDRAGVAPELGCYFTLKYAHLPNLKMVQRVEAKWGGYGNIKAELAGYRLLHEMGGWDYVINLSGSTLPLMPPLALNCWVHRFLKMPGLSGIVRTQPENCCSPLNWQAEKNKPRTAAACADELCTRMYGTPDGLPWWKGSEWKILSADFVRYMFTDHLAQRWHAFFRDQRGRTLNEAWASTVAKYSPFSRSIVYDDEDRKKVDRMMTYAAWNGRNCSSYTNPRPDASPCFLGMGDWQEVSTAKALFARKVPYTSAVVRPVRVHLVFPTRHSPLIEQYCSSDTLK